MRFHCNGTERRRDTRDIRPIFRRYCPTVKEVAGVVDLETIGNRFVEPAHNVLQLSGQCASWRRPIDCPPPEIAERAGEGTLGSGEENRQCSLELSSWPSFLLDQ
jgi:hypothetical protein